MFKNISTLRTCEKPFILLVILARAPRAPGFFNLIIFIIEMQHFPRLKRFLGFPVFAGFDRDFYDSIGMRSKSNIFLNMAVRP